MRRSIVLFLIAGCGGNAKDSALPVDSGLTFVDADGDDDGGTTDGSDDGGSTSGDDDGNADDGDDGGDETGGTSDDSDDGGSGDETGGDETGGDEAGDDTGSADEDCSDAPSDIWEPNDTEGDAEDFGDQDGEEFDINGGYLYPDTDVDRYTFSVTDGWWDGWDFHFDVQVRLTGVPTTADLKLELWHLTNESGEPGFGLVGTSDEAAAGGDEAVSLSEIELTFWTDRGGQYEVIVSSSSGSSCTSPYTITVVADTR